MLQNAYFLAKIGADAAENERNFAEILPKIWQLPYGSRIVAKPAAALLFRRREAKVEEGPQDGLPMGRSPPGCASAESLRVDRRSASRHAELNASCL